jgi:hypothetical protein
MLPLLLNGLLCSRSAISLPIGYNPEDGKLFTEIIPDEVTTPSEARIFVFHYPGNTEQMKELNDANYIAQLDEIHCFLETKISSWEELDCLIKTLSNSLNNNSLKLKIYYQSEESANEFINSHFDLMKFCNKSLFIEKEPIRNTANSSQPTKRQVSADALEIGYPKDLKKLTDTLSDTELMSKIKNIHIYPVALDSRGFLEYGILSVSEVQKIYDMFVDVFPGCCFGLCGHEHVPKFPDTKVTIHKNPSTLYISITWKMRSEDRIAARRFNKAQRQAYKEFTLFEFSPLPKIDVSDISSFNSVFFGAVGPSKNSYYLSEGNMMTFRGDCHQIPDIENLESLNLFNDPVHSLGNQNSPPCRLGNFKELKHLSIDYAYGSIDLNGLESKLVTLDLKRGTLTPPNNAIVFTEIKTLNTHADSIDHSICLLIGGDMNREIEITRDVSEYNMKFLRTQETEIYSHIRINGRLSTLNLPVKKLTVNRISTDMVVYAKKGQYIRIFRFVCENRNPDIGLFVRLISELTQLQYGEIISHKKIEIAVDLLPLFDSWDITRKSEESGDEILKFTPKQKI